MDWREVPVYVTNCNNLERGFRRLLTWLKAAGHTHVAVIDNASTWPPLLEFYGQLREVQLVHVGANKGPYAFWELGMHTRQTTPFVVTDPDVVPASTCPCDLVGRMREALETLPGAAKVGPSLRVDNLPAHYHMRAEVVAWEKKFWEHPTGDGGAYEAEIDTTFALYHPASEAWPEEGTHYRLAPPCEVEHVPWYESTAEANAERAYYKANVSRSFVVHW